MLIDLDETSLFAIPELQPGAALKSTLQAFRRTRDTLAVVGVITLTRIYNQVRGHKTGSSHSGVEDYTREKIKTNQN